MKKSFLFILLSAYLLMFTACTWHIPEKVSVKTQAEYEFSIGSVEKDLGISFTAKDLSEKISLENARLYDYFPEKKDAKVQQFMLKIPLVEIPVNLNEYFKSSSLSESIENMSFSQDVKVPSVNFSSEQNINLSDISDAINTGLTIGGPTASAKIGFTTEFKSVTYSSGAMVLTSDVPDNVTVTLRSGGNSSTGIFVNGKARINLASYTIYKDNTEIEFSSNYPTTYIGLIDKNSVIAKAEGISYSLPKIPLNFAFDTVSSGDDTFESCTVGEGAVNTKIVLPENWSGITVSYEMATTGGITANEPKTPGSEKVIDLKDKTITPAKTNVTAGIYLTLTDATYTNSGNPKFICTSDIKQFSSVTLNLKNVDTRVTKNDKMTEELLETVRSITFASSGLKGVFENNLPEGNAVTLETSSKFIGLSKSTLLQTGKNQNFEIMSEVEQKDIIKKVPVEANEYNSWDFTVKLKFPGYTETNPNRVTINNVTPDTSYHIGFKVEPVINWKEIEIDGKSIQQKDTMNLNLNFSNILSSLDGTIGEKFVKNIKIYELPMYLYCTRPEIDAFEHASFTGAIQMLFKDKTTSEAVGDPIVINKADEKIEFVNYPKLELEDGVVITDVDKLSYSKKADIKRVFNDLNENSDIQLDYDISFTNSTDNNNTIVITPDLLKDDTSASIGIIAAIVLPLKFETAEEIKEDLNSLIGVSGDKDILGRTSASSSDGINEIKGIIESAAISYTANSLPFYSKPDIKIGIDLGERINEKVIGLQSGTFQIRTSEIKALFDTYPLVPNVRIEIDKESILSIPRETKVSMNIKLVVGTNGSYTVYGGK